MPPGIVAGGTPSFPVHSEREAVCCSPGTTVLWDHRSSSSLPDMKFLHAAVLITRVISHPAPGHICIDLGHKAVASEMPHPRVMIFGIDEYIVTNHSEEHMVIRCRQADKMKPGDHLYCIPVHICPTTDRYSTVTVVRNGIAEDEWSVDAHSRRITV
jgi:D-serine deaminase-like pyridoxal phosphate-dependent protein